MKEKTKSPASNPLHERLIFWKRDFPKILGVSVRTVDRWISSGQFPRSDIVLKGRPAWRRETIEAWLQGHAHEKESG